MKTRFYLFAVPVVCLMIFSSCRHRIPEISQTTGWDYNNARNGGFEVVLGYEQPTAPGLVLIEGGSFTMGRVEQDVMYDWNNVPRRVTVSSFYMDQTEVRNVDYCEYLHWISRVFVDYPEVYNRALPDTLVWRSKLGFNEPYVEFYLRHPAFINYPVVGVSWEQANEFCMWRSDRVNEMILIDEGILDWDLNQSGAENFNTDAYLAGQYEGLVIDNLPSLDKNQEGRRVKMEDGIFQPKYRLPTEAEWEYAALALIGNSVEERIFERKIYPWNGHSLRNPDPRFRGQFFANFVRGRGDYMGVAGALNDNADICAPVTSYWPNDYGLYCMAGNVNEWVDDVYRSLSLDDFDEFRPYRGNVFKTQVRDEEGNIAEKDSLGRVRWRDVTEEESAGRLNYSKSDYRNYLDGDFESSILYNQREDETLKGPGSTRMYSQKLADENSLISDETRIYKGGSWKDRAYWLAPGARRFLVQSKSTDDIGFRCAMVRLGSPLGQGGVQ